MPPRPTLALTCGDPAGVGPEIALRAAADARVQRACRLVALGPERVLRATVRGLGLRWPFVSGPGTAATERRDASRPSLIDVPVSGRLAAARPSAAGGRAAARAVEAGVGLCRSGAADGLVTAPLSKEGLALAGIDDPGHTEMLRRLTGARRAAMLFWSRRLVVALLTTHLSLRQALRKVRRARVRDTLVFLDGEHRRWFGAAPHIAVAGLNPHAGEAGLFGDEERRELAPAIDEARAAGVAADGPFSPDTVFLRAARGEFDLVLALYHDQGTIAVKSLCFGRAVNTTLGLPFPRTSVDHGTAYDIVGSGRADATSLVEAVRLAARLARRGGQRGR
jgi:4-hydroxythreonine-4-phosphate dehydrogenase